MVDTQTPESRRAHGTRQDHQAGRDLTGRLVAHIDQQNQTICGWLRPIGASVQTRCNTVLDHHCDDPYAISAAWQKQNVCESVLGQEERRL